VPGLVATQHSGSGKANQFFLRGFNLDHDTDFATHVDGMPVNMRSHGHGQDYTDLNFLIPELVGSIEFTKGSYDAARGDFAGAGSAHINVASRPVDTRLSLGGGDFGFRRALLTGSADVASGTLLNARLGYDLSDRLSITVDALNMLDSNDRDIQYFYESQLRGEPAPVEDRPFHVFEPRAIRAYLEYTF